EGSNLIQGNYIGTNATGTAALGSQYYGILINGVSNNSIGGTAGGARNVILGDYFGIAVFDNTSTAGRGNAIQGNYVGTDASGTTPLGNAVYGIFIGSQGSPSSGYKGTPNNTVGGTAA